MASPFDLTLEQLREHRSAKWSRVPADVLPAWTAEMDVRTAPAIADALHLAVERSDLGYAGDPAPVTDAFAGFAQATWGWDPEQGDGSMRLFADVGQAATEVLRAVLAPGDRVVINPPVYLSFYPWLEAVGLEPLEVPMLDVAAGGRLDLAGMARALDAGARAVLLCTPHNPLGYVYTPDELSAVADLAAEHDALVIADEIHAPLVHPGSPTPFVPFLAVSDAARRVGIALHSPSKAWNTAGLKTAVGVTAVQGRWPDLRGSWTGRRRSWASTRPSPPTPAAATGSRPSAPRSRRAPHSSWTCSPSTCRPCATPPATPRTWPGWTAASSGWATTRPRPSGTGAGWRSPPDRCSGRAVPVSPASTSAPASS
jgi:cysteine-S-conjugate beta-lyase